MEDLFEDLCLGYLWVELIQLGEYLAARIT